MDHKILSCEEIFKGRKISLFKEKHLLPNGRVSDFELVRHPGAVVVLPQDEHGRFILIRQFRPAIGDYLLEVPAGTLEKGENPLECAKRELEEEIGKRASSWQELGQLVPTPGFCDEVQYLYFATGLTEQAGTMDDDEIIESIPMSSVEVSLAIREWRIRDAKSLSILLRAAAVGLFQLS